MERARQSLSNPGLKRTTTVHFFLTEFSRQLAWRKTMLLEGICCTYNEKDSTATAYLNVAALSTLFKKEAR